MPIDLVNLTKTSMSGGEKLIHEDQQVIVITQGVQMDWRSPVRTPSSTSAETG